MNNKNIYSKKFSGYNQARQELEIAHRDFETWAKPKIMAHLENGQRVLAKYNNGRPDPIALSKLPWTSARAGSFVIKEFNEDHAIIQYKTGSWQDSKTEEFKFPLEWLSLSTWAFNKRVRGDIKCALEARRMERARHARVRATETKTKITKARNALQVLEAELARHEKAAKL